MKFQMKPTFESAGGDERIFRALDVLAQYGLDIPVEIIDASDDGTVVGAAQLQAVARIMEISHDWADLAIERLQSQRESIGAPLLTDPQIYLAMLFFYARITLLGLDGALAPYDRAGEFNFNPDALADLKRALFEGIIPQEETR